MESGSLKFKTLPPKDRQTTHLRNLFKPIMKIQLQSTPEIHGELVQDPCRYGLKPLRLYDMLFVHNRYSLACALKPYLCDVCSNRNTTHTCMLLKVSVFKVCPRPVHYPIDAFLSPSKAERKDPPVHSTDRRAPQEVLS